LALHRTTGALATKVLPSEAMEGLAMTRGWNPRDLAGAVQVSLFTPNVIPISAPRAAPATRDAETPAVLRPGQRPKTGSAGGSKPATRRTARVAEGQGELEFLSPAPFKTRTLGTTVDAMIYCEATAAAPLHRAMAAALDWSIVLIGYGLFLATFYLRGGEFYVEDRTNLLIFGAALVLIGCAYGLVWTIAGTETAGMRWTHLRLITFDGYPPDTRHRVMRFFGSCLSLFTVVGVLWALVDEEGLGWQDHISRTFPTADEADSRIFRRR